MTGMEWHVTSKDSDRRKHKLLESMAYNTNGPQGSDTERNSTLLPPASEGWGRYCFHRCVSVHTGGNPYPSHNTPTGPMSSPTNLGQDWMGSHPGLDGVPPVWDRIGWGTPPQDMLCLDKLRRGRYASCGFILCTINIVRQRTRPSLTTCTSQHFWLKTPRCDENPLV